MGLVTHLDACDMNHPANTGFLRPHRLAWPRTLPFQGSNTGSKSRWGHHFLPDTLLANCFGGTVAFSDMAACTKHMWHDGSWRMVFVVGEDP